MSFKLISQINESAEESQKIDAVLESMLDLIEGGASTSEEVAAIWEAADSPKKKTVTETSAAAMGRAQERDWVQSAKQDAEDREFKKHPLELKKERDQANMSKVRPGEGHKVLLGKAGVGTIVAVDDESGQVIIQDREGNEKVFKMAQMHGPKFIPGQDGKEVPAWKLGNE